MKKKIVIGVTGIIGSGKSTIARMLKQKGAALLDADKLAHECLLKGTPTYKKIIKEFGSDILARNKSIDKKKVAEIVFDDKRALGKLCKIIHPDVISSIKKAVKKLNNKVIVIDAPLLIEAGLDKQVDKIIVVKAKIENCVKRAVKEHRITEKEVRKRLYSQMPLEEKTKYADYVVNNDGDLNITKTKLEKVWKELSRGN